MMPIINYIRTPILNKIIFFSILKYLHNEILKKQFTTSFKGSPEFNLLVARNMFPWYSSSNTKE